MEQHIARSADQPPIAYELAGAGPGLLLLAGQGNSHRWWNSVRADFTGWTTITLDWRGTGDTPLGEQPTQYARPLAEDAVAVLDDLGLDRVDVYATSMGGRVAQWFATDHSGRIRRLVLGCTSPGARMGHERSNAVRRRLADPDPHRRTEALIDLMYTPAWRAGHPDRTKRWRPHHIAAGVAAAPACQQRTRRVRRARQDHRADLGAAWPDDELSPAENADILADRIPNGRAVVFPGAGTATWRNAVPKRAKR